MNQHHVTVTPGAFDADADADWRDEASVKFECHGNHDSKCHQYPDCDCEGWDCEHESAPHDECWLQGWFDSEWGAVYNGPEADDRDENCVPRDMERSGTIDATYSYEGYVEWEFAS